MCVNYVNMIPVYCNVVARQGCNTSISCAKCRALMTTDKQLDWGELWRSRHAAPPPKSGGGGPFRIPFRRNNLKQHKQHNNTNNSDQQHNEMNLLKFLAINALELTAPASPILLSRTTPTTPTTDQQAPPSDKSAPPTSWFQLSGHPDSLAPAGLGTVWKRRAPGADDAERRALETLGADADSADLVPRFYREVVYGGDRFIEMQDLLHGFQDPYVMDIKMGTRTFLESEVQKSTARNDLYKKMVSMNPNAPTEEEHIQQAVTKLRYMQFREEQSSSCSQGFRIEAMKMRGSPPVKDLKTVKTPEEVAHTLKMFIRGRDDVRQRLLMRLNEIRTKFEQSEYFKTHEVVGSSLFIIYDDSKVGVWLIDFAKTCPVPEGVVLNHRAPWVQGNHEEGFLFGLDKLISVVEEINFQPSNYGDSLSKTMNTISVKS